MQKEQDTLNPFQVLGLPTSATSKDIIARGDELRGSADEKARLRYRRAVEQLITHPATRLFYELFEMPGARYEDPQWSEFSRAYKRNPFRWKVEEEEKEEFNVLSAENLDPALLARLVALALLSGPLPEISPEALDLPFHFEENELPLEVQDVIFG